MPFRERAAIKLLNTTGTLEWGRFAFDYLWIQKR